MICVGCGAKLKIRYRKEIRYSDGEQEVRRLKSSYVYCKNCEGEWVLKIYPPQLTKGGKC